MTSVSEQPMLLSDAANIKRLSSQLEQCIQKGLPHDKLQRQLSKTLSDAAHAYDKRVRAVPVIDYLDLPVSAKREEIIDLIRDHPVVVLAGETGSGKTTQLPKLCLEAGRGLTGMIGHTQPRRLAARTVASRIADELKVALGAQVGYQVRFNEQVSEVSLIKLMTDGILLAETRQDPLLLRYDTIIIDEAHERSLNIDFLLGYLKLLLPKRPDLKIIVTSATIDVERFAKHFDGAPVMQVSGRTFPVDVWYRPLTEATEDGSAGTKGISIIGGIDQALAEIDQYERQQAKRGGDVLIFLPGERDIREVAQSLRKQERTDWQVLPLYGRLSLAEQQKVFHASGKGRRIVLATNVAETSVTVPGITYVIDPGTARMSRYSYRSKVQRLPIEAISQASANQRKGRCGRVSAGICIRLFSEDDFNARPKFTDAEILRTNLASVILQMEDLRLGSVEEFPFIDPPDNRLINDGVKLLQELGAMDKRRRLTSLGRQIARLPVDPKIARMVLAASELGCLNDILIIASALTIQDPRERPQDRQQAADQKHSQWRDAQSDFVSFVNLWHGYEAQRQSLSQNQLRKWASQQFLSYLRMREWRDVHHQLVLMCQQLKLKAAHKTKRSSTSATMQSTVLTSTPLASTGSTVVPCDDTGAALASTLTTGYELVHRALLTGLLGNIGHKHEDGTFLGPRQRVFNIFPGSSVYKKPPSWVMAAEIIETSRLFARTVARIEPQWIEQAAHDLLKFSYSEPRWHKRQGRVLAMEQVSLYGLILVRQRRVGYSNIDADVCQQLLIMEGLVTGEFQTKGKFLRHNLQLVGEVEQLEAKTRRRDLLVDDQVIFDFYADKLRQASQPITSSKGFERWREQVEQKEPKLLYMSKQGLLRNENHTVNHDRFPDRLVWKGMSWPLAYEFSLGSERDGVTVQVPLSQLKRLPAKRLDWLVPGLLLSKIEATLRGLPKAYRKAFVPVPNYAQAVFEAISDDDGDLFTCIARQLQRMSGRPFDVALLNDVSLDPLHTMGIEVLADNGKVLRFSRSLNELLIAFGSEQTSVTVTKASTKRHPLLQTNLTSFPMRSLPEQLQLKQGDAEISVWPALKDTGKAVDVVFTDSALQANSIMRIGLCRLYQINLHEQIKYLTKNHEGFSTAELKFMIVGSAQTLRDQVIGKAIERLFLQQPWPRNKVDFDVSLGQRGDLPEHVDYVLRMVIQILELHQMIRKQLKGQLNLAWANVYQDIAGQLDSLVSKDWIMRIPLERFVDMPRYLKAIDYRLSRFAQQLAKENMWVQELHQWQQRYLQEVKQCLVHSEKAQALDNFYWHLQEYRVSLFAQQLGTRQPISGKRLNKLWDALVKLDAH